MTSSRLVRGAKTRTIGCICLVLLLGALVYLFQGTQTRLADVQKIANTCSQQAESLSAQLEVLFEYKLRLEKSLQSEKQEKKKTAEEYEKKLKEEKESRELEKTELNKKYDYLLQDKNNLQMKMDEAKENYEKQVSDLTSENSEMKNSVRSYKDDLDKVTLERDDLKTNIEKLKTDLEKIRIELDDLKTKNLPSNERVEKLESDKKGLREKLDKLEKELSDCKGSPNDKISPAAPLAESVNNKPDDNKHALEAPSFDNEGENLNKGSSSTTPGINPQALYTQDSSGKTSTKQTQESKPEPLAQPASNNAGPAPGQGQIPVPPDDSPAKNINLEENRISNQIDTWDDPHRGENNAAIEDLADAPLQGEDDKAPRSRDYPEKEYKDDQGDEDDEEEERMGEFGHQSHLRRDSQLVKFSNMDLPDGGGGVMVNPK